MRRSLLLLIGFLFVVMAGLFLLAVYQFSFPGASDDIAQAPTVTPVQITPLPTRKPASTLTPLPPQSTSTPLPLSTATLIPTRVPTLPIDFMPFQLQFGTHRYIPAFTHLEGGCQWSGIAGQVLDENGNGVNGLIVVITGKVGGVAIDQTGVTAEDSPYGPGGYEITLTNQLPVSDENLEVQLFDSVGQAVSKPCPFRMPSACELNLVLMNFTVDAVE